MATSRRFTLTHNTRANQWELRQEQTGKLYRSVRTKELGTKKGVLEKVPGKEGGSVTIRTKGGVFEEERNFTGGKGK